ncbi:MAG: hypothetical protein Q7J69_00835 [Candidatus Omnitrophota bacterium]|nr:hypothetical protein [Candidatus Omnitrophota bacterium]
MHPKRALLIVIISALLACGVVALLTNIAERKREGRHLEECPCAAVTCPHPGRSVE